MLAPPYDKGLMKRLLAGLMLLLGIAALSMIAVVNAFVVAAINNASPINTIPAPPFEVDATPLLGIWTNFTFAAYYAAVMVLPLIAPIAVWAWLKPRAVRKLLQSPDADAHQHRISG
jgi:hypothetical protein